MRCFFALDLPEAVRAALGTVAAELHATGASLRLTAVAQLHVTLKFLGELNPGQVDAMVAALRATAVPPMQLRLAGLGRFPPRGAARVLWAGLDGDVAAVAALAAGLEDAAARWGIAREERPFTAHVTLARVKSPARSRILAARLEELSPDVVGEPFAPPAVTLYRSELGGQGARYTVLERVPVPAPR